MAFRVNAQFNVGMMSTERADVIAAPTVSAPTAKSPNESEGLLVMVEIAPSKVISVGEGVATTLALVVHELATNSQVWRLIGGVRHARCLLFVS
jgi:hypothetical protein